MHEKVHSVENSEEEWYNVAFCEQKNWFGCNNYHVHLISSETVVVQQQHSAAPPTGD